MFTRISRPLSYRPLFGAGKECLRLSVVLFVKSCASLHSKKSCLANANLTVSLESQKGTSDDFNIFLCAEGGDTAAAAAPADGTASAADAPAAATGSAAPSDAAQRGAAKHSAADFDAEAVPLSSFMLNGQDYSKERSLRVRRTIQVHDAFVVILR